MTDARAISAQLVDVRNIGVHKSIKLTIHVPEEQAMKVMELFGWPTMVAPVPVALARLNEQPKGGEAAATRSEILSGSDASNATTPVQHRTAGRAIAKGAEVPCQKILGMSPSVERPPDTLRNRPRRSWNELSAAEQAGIRCAEGAFWTFLTSKFGRSVTDAETAAQVVRYKCGVKSRAEITDYNEPALDAWNKLDIDYRLWMMVPA